MVDIKCSFCGKHRTEVRKLISGPNVYVCDECVALCNRVIEQEEYTPSRPDVRPQEIVDELDRYVVGQSGAKRALAVAVYNHYKRISYRARPGDVELSKGNIMLIGPTGCGKTLLAQALARKLDVPLAMADATTLTEAGYVGEDVESVIKGLYRAAEGDVDRAAKGIICIDEVDKLARRGGGPSSGRDVSGEGVQQALLRLLEGRRATITPDGPRSRPQQDAVQLDTTNVLFICTGAFNGLDQIVRQRIEARAMGFGSTPQARRQNDADALRAMTRHEDLVKFGLIPEFMGRIPVLVACDGLDEQALIEVLWRPRNALLRQYERLLALDGARLHMTEDALAAVAAEAFKRRSGARALRAVLEEVMLDVMYNLPSLEDVIECVIDSDAVINKSQPKLIRKKKAS